jgi:UPF0755 protein
MQLILKSKLYILVFPFIFFAYINYQIFIPINNFPTGKVFEIEKGQSANKIFSNLQKEGFIKSVFWAKVLAKIFNYNKYYPGEYQFDTPQNLYDVIFNITKRPVSYAVLIPEGFTKKQVAERVSKYVRDFDQKKFLASSSEGYLFPDTYYFFKFSSTEEVLKEMQDKFYSETFKKFGKTPTREDIIVASILEREARDPNDMKIIAGIYYNRLKVGMPLQVDATVLYGQGAWKERTLYHDLKHDSDYNTYLNQGLPIGPISNPGLSSLDAAMNPTKTDYLYYLTGKDGKMYFAKDFTTHVKNKLKYLR